MNTIRALCVSLSLVTAALPARAQPAQANVAYGSDPAQVLDIYQPASPGPHHLVVFVHGGGWTSGSKGGGHVIAPPLIAAGYTVASVEYRKAPQTDPAGETSDAAHAVAYLLKNARTFNIDPARFALLGHSSGAHMVALLATDSGYLRGAGVDPAKLAAAVTLDGVFDVTANLTEYPSEKRLGVFGQDRGTWQHYSPTEIIRTTDMHPRFCALHEDTNRRFGEQAKLLEDALRKSGAKFDATTVHGYTHGELVQSFSDPGNPMAAFALSCLGKAFGGS